MFDLSGMRVLVTGGAGAIGQVIVRRLTEHGAAVVVNDVVANHVVANDVVANDVVANDVVANHGVVKDVVANDVMAPGGGLAYVDSDASSEVEVERLLDEAERLAGGSLDAVCLHAGLTVTHPIDTYPSADYDRVMGTNVRAAFLLAQGAAARWKGRGEPGHLVFTTSWVQDVPWPEIGPYSASKAALKSLMRSFARELAPHGIRSNAVAPGIVGVGMAKKQWDTEPQYRARASRAIPLGQLQTPESVADAFAFLLSPMASYMTGSVLLVDGGASLYPMDG